MFCAGHLMWIGISACLIAAGYIACRIRKPREDSLLKVCLAIGVLSEAIKLFSVMRILPMVEVAVKGEALEYLYGLTYSALVNLVEQIEFMVKCDYAYNTVTAKILEYRWEIRHRNDRKSQYGVNPDSIVRKKKGPAAVREDC